MNFSAHIITCMDTQWLILLGVTFFIVLMSRTVRRHEGFANAGNAEDDFEEDDEDTYEDDEDVEDVKPLTTEPDTRKVPKQQSTLRAAPVVAEADKPKAKPITKVLAPIKANVAAVKQAFKVEKVDPKKQAMAKYLDKNAILFTPRKMLCMPSTSGFQCIFQ